jgi:transposase
MRYELADNEWSAIKPMLPNKPRGVPRVNDRRALNGIFWGLRSGAPWRDLPDDFGLYTTYYNRFVAGETSKLQRNERPPHLAGSQLIRSWSLSRSRMQRQRDVKSDRPRLLIGS